MPLPDQRIRLSAPTIDFDTQVGVTGQEHDNYPAPRTQARFDHMRLYLIGLLCQQASYDPPVEYREGTPWFDLNTMSLKIRKAEAWRPYADALEVEDGISLSTFYQQFKTTLKIANGAAFRVVGSAILGSRGVTKVVNVPAFSADLEAQIICKVSTVITLPPITADEKEYTIIHDIDTGGTVTISPAPDNMILPILDNKGDSVTVRTINSKWMVVAEVAR